MRWHRDIIRRRWAGRSVRGKAGRPATRRNIKALVLLWVPKTCATWPDAPLIVGCSAPRRLPGRGMIFGLWA